jgi:hypothetical protein
MSALLARAFGRGRGLVLAAVLVGASASAQAQRGQARVRGQVRDSASREPVAGALVEVRTPADRRTTRTDEEGLFQIGSLDRGDTYRVSVRRVGYAELTLDLPLSARDTSVVFAMRRIAQSLDVYRIRADVNAVYGIVASLPDLLPISGAKVELFGTGKSVTTDTTGAFFIEAKDAGTYLLRMSADGYVDRTFRVDVPRGRALDVSRMLDPGEGTPRSVAVVFKDLDQRLRMRSANNSAIVSGAEIRKAGSNLIDGLMASPSWGARAFRLPSTVCVFVNGLPRPGVTPEAFAPEEIESVEVYAKALSGTGDRSRSLELAWPPGAPCGPILGRTFRTPGRSEPQNGVVQYLVIWLRK